MTRVLSGNQLKALKEFLALPCGAVLDSPHEPDLWRRIRDWAQDPEHGALPVQSAQPFTDWLNLMWEGWTEEPERTVGAVFEGAVTEWCGGRTL